MIAPTVQPTKAEDRPMISAVRAPKMIREKISRPNGIGAEHVLCARRLQHGREIVRYRIVGSDMFGEHAGEQHHQQRQQAQPCRSAA